MPRAVPEVHFKKGCKAASGRFGSSENVDTVEGEATKFHTCGPAARDRINRRDQNSYENTHCETIQKRGNVTNVKFKNQGKALLTTLYRMSLLTGRYR